MAQQQNRTWRRGKNGPPTPGPQNFDPATTLTNADFTQSTFVQAAYNPDPNDPWDYTVYAYTSVNHVDGFTITEVAHAHITGDPAVQANWGPGRSFTPGLVGFSTPTPNNIVTYLSQTYHAALGQAVQNDPGLPTGLILHGAFPGSNRYPH